MLKKTLLWRKENNIDSIMEEDLGEDLAAAFFTNGVDREGHPISYNAYGVFENQELYAKAFGDEEKRKHFLRWRIQQLEKEVQKLQLKPGCVTSLLQISDLKNSPSPSKKELRVAMKQAVGILQDNYPELVARNIFINVPFWYYAFNALLSPFSTQRTRSTDDGSLERECNGDSLNRRRFLLRRGTQKPFLSSFFSLFPEGIARRDVVAEEEATLSICDYNYFFYFTLL
ncbi:unnamed protein product [Linum tenue]|uniref:CRAL-TRIO domain-containing protein n=1 Tax=Linum tenue TaxID=586396 RepID=A0AAV0PLN4_9ROSI|nr:unnamed protein product [Linum tenue]